MSSRGSGVNPNNRFFKQEYSREHEEGIDLSPDQSHERTSYLEVFPKSIVNKVTSPDVGMDYSLNPIKDVSMGVCTATPGTPTNIGVIQQG